MTTFEKFEFAPSLNHSWKFQVSPDVITPPGGLGRSPGTSKPVPVVDVPEMLSRTPTALNLPREFSWGRPRLVAVAY